jgi:hemolysin activation/secretion protein
MSLKLLHIVFGILLMGFVNAQEQADSAKEVNSRKPLFRVLPTAYYTPETRIAGEVFGYLKFYSKGAERASNIRMFLAVTQNRQITLDLPWQVYFSDEKFFLNGKLDARKFPEYFYGIGNQTEEKTRTLYRYNSFGFRNLALWKLNGKNYAGISSSARILKTHLDLEKFDHLMESSTIIGSQGYSFIGLGPAFVHDSRDVILNSTKGSYLELLARYHIGETPDQGFQFWNVAADLRQYFRVTKTTVIAYQAKAQCSFGEIPYRELPALGGPMLHRGYYFGRFRDDHLGVVQAEIRQHLFWRLGAVAFGSVGKVFNNDDLVFFQNYRPAAGGGLRFKLSKKDEANIRFDVAVTPDSYGFYIFFAEAF